MENRYWVVTYLAVGIFFGLFTGAGLAMPAGHGFNIMKFMFVLAGLILLIVLMFLNMKIGRILKNL
jgi:hypothetical protein